MSGWRLATKFSGSERVEGGGGRDGHLQNLGRDIKSASYELRESFPVADARRQPKVHSPQVGRVQIGSPFPASGFEEEVLRLEIPVHDAAAVHVLQGAQYGAEGLRGLSLAQVLPARPRER